MALAPPSARAEDAPAPQPPAIDYANEILPLLNDYCVRCHGQTVRKGGLDLSRFQTAEQVQAAFDLWERIGPRIRNNEMPPLNEDAPTPEEREKLLKWIEGIKPPETLDCNLVPNDENFRFYRGYVMSRRMNRYEYANTIRDLFGQEINIRDRFPKDGSGGVGFDNNGDALFISSIMIEKYIEAADEVLAIALPVKSHESLTGAARDAAREEWLAGRAADLAPDDTWTSIFTEYASQNEGARPAREVARDTLRRFAYRAYRRPPRPDEIEKLLAVFDRAHARGDSFEAGIRLAIKTALISPRFIFLAEPEPEHEGVYRLGDFQLASRLSYFLWASMPDDELFSIAEWGMLSHPPVLQSQIRRMLLDPKSRGLSERFVSQWLEIEGLGGVVKPDPGRFPEFTPELVAAMREEAVLLFDSILRENRNLLELINSDYTHVNAPLAKIYGIEGVEGPDMRRVQVADANRGGALGMAGVLTVTSHPLRTSPVLRGKWVMEQILGERVPPPPPDVPALPEDERRPDGLTMRQMMEAHRANPECASCHQKMDPIGLGLENFDPIGRWRVEQNGQPLDTAGALPSGETFSGPAELKRIILERKDQFAAHLTKKMLGYALGRDITRLDKCVIDETAKNLAANDYRAWVLVENIILSYPFSHRYAKK